MSQRDTVGHANFRDRFSASIKPAREDSEAGGITVGKWSCCRLMLPLRSSLLPWDLGTVGKYVACWHELAPGGPGDQT
jgi:hypothetical protein